MQLTKKRNLAARTLGVGKERIIFNNQRLDEIKEAITKQDIKDLFESKAIILKEKIGRKTILRRKTRKRAGSVKKKVNKRKQEYMAVTRKLRAFLKELRTKKIVSDEEFWKLRKEIRNRNFKNKSQIKDRINQMIKDRESKK